MIAYKMVKDIYEDVEKIRTGKKKNIFDLNPTKNKWYFNEEVKIK